MSAQYSGQLYFLTGSVCVTTPSTPGYSYWQLGAEVDYTQFVSGTIATE